MDLTALKNLQTVGTDAFSAIVGLQTVTLSQDQATRINPGVFSGVEEQDPSKPSSWTITNGSNNLTTYTPTAWPNTTVTVANNLNRLDKIQTIDLSQAVNNQQQSISTLAGGVLFNNQSIQTLKLPASATNWKLTEVKDYSSSPVGWSGDGSSSANKLSQGIFFEKFTLNSTQAKKNAKSNDAFNRLTEASWSQVASILNMFGYTSSESKNLAPWKENFQGPDLDASSVKSGWSSDQNNQTWPGDQELSATNPQANTPYYKLVNNLIWKYEKSGQSITLTISDPGKSPNLYRAGYTGNPFASYQVGFGESGDNNISKDTQVNITLKLVGN